MPGLTSSSTSSIGSNNSVQYNPKTKDVFFFTENYSEHDGSCQYEEYDCLSLIRKTNFEKDEDAKVIYELEGSHQNWIVNSIDNSVFISHMEWNSQKQEVEYVIEKISGENGEIVFKKNHSIKENVRLFDFALSSNGKYIYQLSSETNSASKNSETLGLIRINVSDGSIDEQVIDKPSVHFHKETNISPDQKYLAFYAKNELFDLYVYEYDLYIYEIATNKLTGIPLRDPIHNYNLIWSGDSKKLFLLLENSPAYFDIEKSRFVPLPDELKKVNYAYSWAPSEKYLAYLSDEYILGIFDYDSRQLIDTGISEGINVVGFSWY